MRMLVCGAGMQGIACAYDLLRNPAVEKVCLVDRETQAITKIRQRLRSDRLELGVVDCADPATLASLFKDYDVAISALPYRFNLNAARAAVTAATSFVDMGGNTDVVLDELRLAPLASQAGVLVVPDCGLAPGLANILVADAVATLEDVEKVAIRVGGLPQRRIPPWDYRLVFSIDGLLNEYTGTAAVLRDWNRTEVPVLEGLEALEFPAPIGDCEAAYTSGGSSTLPWSFAGRVRNLDYKTVRYPGHYQKLRVLQALGLFSDQPLAVGPVKVAPLDLARELLARAFDHPDVPDAVVLRITSRGRLEGRPTTLVHELLDLQDPETGLTAMMRTTAFPVSIIAQLIGSRTIEGRGAFPPEKLVPPKLLIDELARRGIVISRKLIQD